MIVDETGYNPKILFTSSSDMDAVTDADNVVSDIDDAGDVVADSDADANVTSAAANIEGVETVKHTAPGRGVSW